MSMPAPPAVPTVGAPNHTADHATISAILGGLQVAVSGLQGSSPAFLLAGGREHQRHPGHRDEPGHGHGQRGQPGRRAGHP
jgi:hypothetical protein